MRRAILSALEERLAKIQQLKHELIPQPPPSTSVEFNERIGWPKHPVTNQPHDLFQYQYDLIECKYKDVQVVKSNKIGITEAVLRDMIQKGVNGDCRGYQLMLGAQGLELAKENMRRLQAIFNRNKELSTLIQSATVSRLVLQDGTTYFVMPRRAAAIRGWPRLKYAFLDEAAHYGLLDDEEFLAATLARLTNTQGYLRVVSTPKGQRGFFHRRYVEAKTDPESTTKVYEWSYHVALNELITPEFIEDAKKKLGPSLFSQEFEAQFIGSGNAAIPADLIERSLADYEVDVW